MNTNSAEIVPAQFSAPRLGRIVERVFRGYTGSLGVRLWDGIAIPLGPHNPIATVVVPPQSFCVSWRGDLTRCASQILAANTREGLVGLPLTRHDIYQTNGQL